MTLLAVMETNVIHNVKLLLSYQRTSGGMVAISSKDASSTNYQKTSRVQILSSLKKDKIN
jgi:hypothetical protein